MVNSKRRVTVLYWLIGFVNGRVINPLYFQSPRRPHKEINELELITAGKYENSLQSASGIVIRNPRLSESDWSWYNIREPSGNGTYSFGYDNAVDPDGNEHYRTEEKTKNKIVGEYGFTDYKNHRYVKIIYYADSQGFRANTETHLLDPLMKSSNFSTF